MNGDLNMNGHNIIGVGDPTSAQDLITKRYANTTFLKIDGSNSMKGKIDTEG